MINFRKPNFQQFIIITFLLLILMSACREFQRTTTTTPEMQPEGTKQIAPTTTSTSIVRETQKPDNTQTPFPTPVVVNRPGSPLPTNLEVIAIENIDQIQHLATWGTGSPNDIQVSSDGQILAVGTATGIHLYDTLTLNEIAIRETPHSVMSVAFSPDNDFIAVGQVGGSIDIYARIDFSHITHLTVPDFSSADSYKFECFFFPEISKFIGVIRTDQNIIINQWTYDDWEHTLSFSIDSGLTAFINSTVGSIGVITEDSLLFQSIFYQEDTKQINLPESLSKVFWGNFVVNEGDIAPTSDGEGLLINNGSSIVYWEISSEEITYQLEAFPSNLPDPCQDVAETCLNDKGEISWVCQETAPPPIETITLTPDNIMIVIARNDNGLELRRVHDGLLAWKVESHYKEISFSPGSEFFFGLREDGLIEKRLSETGTLLGTIEQHPGNLSDIVFSPNGKEIAAALNDGWIHIYNTTDGQPLGLLEGNAKALAFSPGGALMAAGLQNGVIRIFTLSNGGHFDLEGHRDTVNDLKFSEDGSRLLSGSADCSISLWDLENQERTQRLIPGKEQPIEVLRVDFSPAEVLGYLAGDMSGLYAVNEDAKFTIEGLISLRDLAVSGNKQTLAVTGSGTSIFTDIQEEGFSTSNLLSVKGNTLALNEDGSLLVVASGYSLEFWSAENKTRLHTFYVEDMGSQGLKPIRLAFSPDNRLIALAYQNGSIQIFGIGSN